MGAACSATEEDKTAKQIDKMLKQELKNRPVKLLLLGPGESGKSTVFKQARALYNDGFKSDEERLSFVPSIHANCIEGIKKLIVEAQKSNTDLSQINDMINEVLKIQLGEELNVHKGQLLERLWATQAIKFQYNRRSEFQLQDSVGYFLDNIQRVSAVKFTPSVADVMRTRVRTSGIVEKQMYIGKANFNVVDVGGQRGERRKWIHCFDGVHAIIFVCAISEYNQVLMEDEQTNRLLEGLSLFNEIVNLPVFGNTAVITFFNKMDLFQEKMLNKQGDLKNLWPEYEGGHDVEEACKFLKNKFLEKSPRREEFEIDLEAEFGEDSPDELLYFHTTCATDPDMMMKIFESVEDVVAKENLRLNELY